MRKTQRLFWNALKGDWRDQVGAVPVEVALLMVLVSGLLFGVVEIARYGLLRYHLEQSTYHAARYLALNPADVDTARSMIRTEVERNTWGGIGEVQLYVKNARREGQCLLLLESKVHYTSSVSWLFNDPSAQSAHVWPQASGCGETVSRPLPTRTPTPTATPTPTQQRTAIPVQLDQAEGLVMVNANMRLGPGFEYAIVGRLSKGETIQVRGRDASGTWLQVVPERIGWVYAPLIQLEVSVASLRTVIVPPVPQRTPAAPPHMTFRAEPSALEFGKCATLYWSAESARFVTLDEQNVKPKAERLVCPERTQKYVLSAGYEGDRFYDREVIITVGSNLSSQTP